MAFDTRTDEQLVTAYIAGQEAAFTHLAGRYQARFIKFAYRRLENYADADDAIQNTWLNCWQNLVGFNDTRKFSSWLYKICRDECNMLLREKERYKSRFAPLPDDLRKIRAGPLLKAALYKESHDRILAVLNHRQRELWKLIVVRGKHYEDVIRDEELFRNNNIETIRNEFAIMMELVYKRWRDEIDRLKSEGAEFEDASIRFLPQRRRGRGEG